MKAILEKIGDICHENVTLIEKTYDEMITKIGKIPIDEKDLVKLKDIIDGHEIELNKLNNKVNKVN